MQTVKDVGGDNQAEHCIAKKLQSTAVLLLQIDPGSTQQTKPCPDEERVGDQE